MRPGGTSVRRRKQMAQITYYFRRPSDPFFQLKALVLLIGLAICSYRLTYSSKHKRVAFQMLHLYIEEAEESAAARPEACGSLVLWNHRAFDYAGAPISILVPYSDMDNQR